MRKTLFGMFLATFSVFLFTSCNNDQSIEQVQLSESSEFQALDKQSFSEFCTSVDKINKEYYALYGIKSPSSRGVVRETLNHITGQTADKLGGVVGSWIGKRVGTAIGAAAGNPVTAVGGYVVGRWAGNKLGSAIASIGSALVLNYAIDQIKGCTSGRRVKSISFDNPYYSDSIGSVHNRVMTEMLAKDSIYFTEKEELDFEKLYADCAKYIEEYDSEDALLYTDSLFKAEMIAFCKDCCELAEKGFREEISQDTFLSEAIKLLEKYDVPKEDIELFTEYGIKVIEASGQIQEEKLEDYTNELNQTICNSKLSEEQKAELSSATDLIINSGLVWRAMNE